MSRLKFFSACNPAGTITVDNPNSTYYTGAFAQTVDSTTNCTVVLVSFNATIVISDCSIVSFVCSYVCGLLQRIVQPSLPEGDTLIFLQA